ncbi:MAG: hypothetical protein U0Q18_09875 [Bryobacteraceae bacterium]
MRDALPLFADTTNNLFEPVAVVGLFGTYFFFGAPLLHVVSDYWFTWLPWTPKDIPADWRPWLGAMALLNIAGLCVYKMTCRWFVRMSLRRRPPLPRVLDRRSIAVYAVPFLALTAAIQVYVYYRLGGLTGFVASFSRNRNGQASEFEGLGSMFVLGAGFPAIVAIVGMTLFKRHCVKLGPLGLAAATGVMFGLVLIFGGLYGSRGNTVFSIILILGMYHLTVKPLSKRWLLGAAVCGMAFMYVYGFYKANPFLFTQPAELLRVLSSSDSRSDLEQHSRRTGTGVLLGDLGRSDVQAFLLYRMMEDAASIEYANGRTYTDGAINFIPNRIIGYRPPGKLKYGTNVVYGAGTYSPTRQSVQIYGLAGEMMLNFGVATAPLSFVLLGAAVAYARTLMLRLPRGDPWRYLIPIVSIGCVVVLGCDLDNVIFFLIQHALVPFIFIGLCSVRLPGRYARPNLACRPLVAVNSVRASV